ncbi:MAG: cysteine--tRNA ligase [Burkholderiaceae bacterium]
MSLRIYNTLTRALTLFAPIQPGQVRMYVCGMTVYDLCHIGHARSMLVFDVVQRWLKASGYAVIYVRNVTDIDDKIIQRAVANNETIRSLTDRMVAALHQDADALGIERPAHEPRATQFVPQMLQMIQVLERKGLAYSVAGGDVNFSVRKASGYGKLSGKSLDEMRAGERAAASLNVAERSAIEAGKQDPLDFVLWKSAKTSEPIEAQWDAQDYGYSRGRPGWHIECSAMCAEILGGPIDIHGGGADLQFPHHENEIAQSEAATGQPLANIWMHNGFVRVDNEKMSKSLGNFFTIREVLARYDPETVRFFIVRAHYRTALNYSDVHLDDARTALRRLYTALAEVPAEPYALDWHNSSQPAVMRFKAAMDDDFGTPGAIAVLFELATEVNTSKSAQTAGVLKALGACLGLLQAPAQSYLQAGAQLDAAAITSLIAQRAAAKNARDFAAADAIRKQLLVQGIVLKDTPSGTTWESLASSAAQ